MFKRKKYKLIQVPDRQEFQIVALRGFGNVKRGDLGGFVESEKKPIS